MYLHAVSVTSVVARKLGCQLKIKLRWLKEGARAHCALLSDLWPKIQLAITTFSAGEFCRQPALSDNTV